MRNYKLPDINYKPETVILANGAFPSHEIALSILRNAKLLVCCDGAINQLCNHNIEPSAIVGDCDSLSNENKIKYKDIIHINSDQETNDLTKAVQYCIDKNITDITILGATGKRDDHTLGNISLLAEYIDNVNVEMITDYGVFNSIQSDSEFESLTRQQVSIFSIIPCPITTFGLKYPVESRTFTNWWQGTLNETLNNSFVIKVTKKTIIYRVF